MVDDARARRPHPPPIRATAGAGAGGVGCGVRRRWAVPKWLLRVGFSILVWTVLMQLTSVAMVWQPPLLPSGFGRRVPGSNATNSYLIGDEKPTFSPPALLPRRVYKSHGYLRVSCNGGLNQMRAAICDMVAIARFLNLTLVIPELDKRSFWADPSDFGDIFNVRHFIDSLRDEVKIIETVPLKFNRRIGRVPLSMPPVSWSTEAYYLKQILPLIRKRKIIHFNRTDARLANNGLPVELQKLRCHVNYAALMFTPRIEAIGDKLISILRRSGPFVVLHLRYEMDMLSFSGCTHGCSSEETEELTRMRYAYPWWKEKEIESERKRLDGLCPLTPEETALVLQALGFSRDIQIYIASGEIYGGERRMAALWAAYPKIVRKEMLLTADELKPFQNHSTQMAALDYLVSVASDVFIPSYDGNMARVVEGHRRYLGFRKTVGLDRKKLVELLDMFQNNELPWDQFSIAVREAHKDRMGQPTARKVVPGRPKEEDYFYSNPQECLGPPKDHLTHKIKESSDI